MSCLSLLSTCSMNAEPLTMVIVVVKETVSVEEVDDGDNNKWHEDKEETRDEPDIQGFNIGDFR